MRLDGTGLETFAAGVRNSVGAPVSTASLLSTWCCAWPHLVVLVCHKAPPSAAIMNEISVSLPVSFAGFDWHPDTGELWATNNARQFVPPTDQEPNRPDDGLYYIPNKGRDFGFPYCHW